MKCDQCINGWIMGEAWPERCPWCWGSARLSVYRIAQATGLPVHAVRSVFFRQPRQKTALRVLRVLCKFL